MVRTVVALVVLAPWAVWAAVRTSGVALEYPVAPALAFTPYVALTAIVPVLVALVLVRKLVAALALIPLALLAAAIAPRFTADRDQPTTGAPLTVMSINTLQGRARPDDIMGLAQRYDVDVLALQESRPDLVARINALGGAQRFPYASGAQRYDEVLLSRLALRETGRQAEGDIRLAGRDVRFTVVHPYPPLSRAIWRGWRAELEALPAPRARHVLLGDFNATLDHPELHDVLDRGYRDAADLTGTGWPTTWPNGRRFPPEITIDHVLISARIGVRTFAVREVRGSDHRAVIARLVVR